MTKKQSPFFLKRVLTLAVMFIMVCFGTKLAYAAEYTKPEGEETVNNFDDAFPLNAGDTYVGYIPKDDAQYFKFTALEDGIFSVSFEAVSPSGDNTAWNVQIYNDDKINGGYIVNGKNIATNSTTPWVSERYGLKKGTEIRVAVDKKFTSDSVSAYKYRVKIIFEKNSNYEYEYGRHKNDAGLAKEIAVNTSCTGSCFDNNDDDWFKFVVPDDGKLTLKTTYESGNSGYWYMGLFKNVDGENELIYDENVSTANRTATNSSVIGVKKGEEYYIKVYIPITVSSLDYKEYTITPVFEADANFEKEKNDSEGTATALTVNQACGATLMHDNDKDYFKIDVTSSGKLAIRADYSNREKGYVYYELYKYDTNGNKVNALDGKIEFSNGSFMKSDETDAKTGETYYLYIYKGVTSSSVEGYDYKITPVMNTAPKVTAPKATSIVSVKSAKKRTMTVKWKKQAAGTTGYRIRYSLKKNMSGAKLITVANANTTSKTIKNLKGGKKYYVQVCTYKKVGKKIYASKWSAKKTVKIKK